MAKEGRGSVAPELGTALGEGYELVRYLGAGGTGAVYEALRADGRRVAVKVLFGVEPAAPGSEILGRYRREVSVLATLESPHIVPVIDAGLDARRGLPFLVMPLLLGLDVLELVRRVGALHPTLAVRIARQACRALEAAHGAGVVHRDIKPANLFLDHDRDGRVTVRLLDFGVAKWRADNIDITQTGTLLGTPRYMAPEQMQGAKQVDARADLWGLGATLYHALSGAVPYADAATVAEVCIAVMTRDLPALQERAPWIDPALAAVVHGALLRDREARCPSATALHDALGPLTAGSDELGAGMLHGAPAELRVRRAPRAGLLSSWRQTEPSRAPDTVPEAAADPLLGRSVAGRYTLLRRLGGGGMGAVYEAEDEGGRRFAVKVLDPQRVGTGAVALARFVREARALTSIASEHVVRVIEVGTDPGAEMPYIVMERLQGLDLGVVIERQGPLAPCTAARLLGQAARGLGTAHRLGLVHRDIKPANLFLHELPSGQIAVKICDFGIVKRIRATDDEETTAQLTRAGGVVGSPAYMSPEQAKDARDIDVRTDVWSLGVSLFRALSGTLPWAGRDSVGELIVAICTEPLPHLQDLAPWVPAGLAEIVHRAMRRDPAERFQSMDELARALEPFTAGRIEVEAAEIAPLAVELRAQVPARAAPPEGATGSGETESRAAASMPVPAATRRRRGTL
ncbi:MAG: serine/threonine protein kinase, partial [Deltaproteobacteria bacterium]|nr:serine/threonine protein kinase [Deltaproteobacteria bacterium]